MNEKINNDNNLSIAVSTRVRLARNLKHYPFPNKLTLQAKNEIAQKIKTAIENSNSTIVKGSKFIDMKSLDQTKAVSLVERHLISPEFATNTEGRYLFLSQDEDISIMINEEDHIRIQVISNGYDIEKTYKIAEKIDTLLNNEMPFAFDSTLGYLTQCPSNLGTALRASVMLHLPCLQSNKTINRISGSLSKLGLTLRGTYGEGTQAKAALYQLSNQVTLGLSEKTALDNLISIANQIISQEEIERKAITQNIETLDIISRSEGVLLYAKVLGHGECLNALSNVRLGVVSGVIKDIKLDTIDKLMVEIQPATLMANSGKNMTPDQRDILRALTVQEKIIKDKSGG